MFKPAIALSIVLFCSDLAAQATPPNRPERPEPPARPVIERQAERQLERLERQLDAVNRQLPTAAAKGLQRAEQNISRGLRQADKALAQAGGKRRNVVSLQGDVLLTEIEVEQGWRAIEREWIMLLSDEELALLTAQFPAIMAYRAEQQTLPALGLNLIRLIVPAQLNNYQAIEQLLPDSLTSAVDRNHLYQPQAQPNVANPNDSQAQQVPDRCPHAVRIGVIDSAVEASHPAFLSLTPTLVTKSFINDQLPFSAAHGTAVVSRLVTPPAAAASSGSDLTAIFAAAAFYHTDQHDTGALNAILQALEWLAANNVQVVNMSLTGPDNRVLARAIKQVLASDIAVVAAAGNAGPAAQPLYPAAYPGVIAVTAVDNNNQVYRWANRGDYIDYAAPGVEVSVAQPGNSYASLSGTSMAAPLVTKRLACELAEAAGNLQQALLALQQGSVDLGRPGKDAVFGYGVLKIQP